MRRVLLCGSALLIALALPLSAGAHDLDHPAPSMSGPVPASTGFNSGGEGAVWDFIATFATGNPHTDLDFFTQDDKMYASVGTLAAGGNGGGQTIVQLMKGDQIDLAYVSAHPSATCVSNPAAALGLQHDVEATPKGDALLNTRNRFADRRDTQLLIDATDHVGRCHDQGVAGLVSPPRGGLEIVDVTDVANPVEIGLTSHIGESHTVNIDPKRPHIAYVVTSDGVSVNKGKNADDPSDDFRENETAGDNDQFDLDGFEVVDLSSCMDFAPDTSVVDKRKACRPEVFRYRYPTMEMSIGHTSRSLIYGCHELEVYPNDLLTCGSGQAMIMLDMSDAFIKNGPGYLDDKPKGTRLPCRVRPSTSTALFWTDAMVTDCVKGEEVEGKPTDLSVPGWRELGSPSLEGVEHVGTAFHMGRTAKKADGIQTAYGPKEDIDFNHEAELTDSGKFTLSTDERGGGVSPPGASCSPGADNPEGNGGVHAHVVARLQKTVPTGENAAEKAWKAYARTPEGDKAVYRAEVHTQPQVTVCTAHVFQQIPGHNRIFMGWYSQGTQVVDFVEHKDGTFEFKPTGYFIPENANTWTSAIFHYEQNNNGTITYYGATGDFNIGTAGRNAIDVYKVTLPPPAQWQADQEGKKKKDKKKKRGKTGGGGGTDEDEVKGTVISGGPAARGATGAGLAATGSSIGPIFVLGLALVTLGLALARAPRRRDGLGPPVPRIDVR